MPVENSSVDLLTVCQAIHWFNLDQFYSEVDRVLKPNGVLVLIGYQLTGVHNQPEINLLRDEIYENLKLKKHFNSNIAILDDTYKNLAVPYKNPIRIEKDFVFKSSLKNFIKEIPSWSGFQAFKKAEGTKTAQQVLDDLTEKCLKILNSKDQDRLLQSAAQRALRSERRSQKWERERERRSLKKMGARARAAL